ncbi:hypothetical protein CHLNCDRAFT_141587 [Chlorella variabilis]|uniref:Uncharacterized protein n=1 Tax=Chlorella variabilis TaxID=554065 RepID=E1ZT96_CHLVA|nr:hypothetical protein CHLNCDRAFT_141587 [Chlorella variabilis]EFN50961.1 hypothetical protein CHLNCDRAFT_141587 [Chlorella variabilis]|eukprot:XP_005843063.1 hypothetical protein CHLNCDRAFT_141587 [Chlorella variabilis]
MTAGKSGLHPAADYVAGAIAGSANIALGFPADTVKVRLQNRLNPYNGAWHCATSMLRNEGARSLYRGMSPQLVGGAVETGVNYAVYQAMLGLTQGPRLALPEAAAVPLSAAAAGAVLSVVLSPAELVKCRLQLGGTERYHSYRGPVDCLRQTVQQEGLRGLMRGLSGTMAREIPGNAIYFSTYRLLRYWVSGGDPAATAAAASGATVAAASQPRSLLAFLVDSASAVVCGGLAGMVMWAAVLPLDVAKTRIQTAYPGSYQDVGVARQLHMVYREGGIQALYAGLSPTLARAFPANAAQWLAWELCMQQMQQWGGGGGRGGSST